MIPVKEAFSVREATNGFMVSLVASNRYSWRYLESLRSTLGAFASYADAKAWPPVFSLTVSHVEEYLVFLQQRPKRAGPHDRATVSKLSQSTIETHYRNLKRFWGWLLARGHAEQNPLDLIPHPKINERVIVYPDADAALKLLRSSSDGLARTPKERFLRVRDHAILCLFLDTPGRLSELSGLRLGDLDQEAGGIRVLGKGGRERWMGLAKTSMSALRAYLRARAALHSSHDVLWVDDQGQPLQDYRGRAIYQMIKRLRQRAGLPTIHPHAFRHRYVMESLESSMSPEVLRYLGGWRKQIPETYWRTLGMSQAVKAHQLHSPLDRLMRQAGKRPKPPRRGVQKPPKTPNGGRDGLGAMTR